MESCTYFYVRDCGKVSLKVLVTVYPNNPSMKEKSIRRMCKSCFEYLKADDETLIHSISEIKNPG